VFCRILLITVVLIVYGSLYPFAFHSALLPAGPLTCLLHSWPAGLDRFIFKDVVLNVLIYLPIGFFGCLAFGRSRLFSALLAVVLGLALSGSMELLQLYDDSRTSSALDVVSNVAGAAAGVGLAFLYGRRVARLLANPRMTAVARPSAALLLLCCWLGYQSFPLIPQLSRTQLSLKLSLLLRPSSFSVIQGLGTFIAWLMLARLLETVSGARTIFWMLLLLPARLFITGRTFTWPEAIGAVCACILWRRGLCRFESRTALLAWLAVTLLLLRGLAPYHWQSTASAFSWMPFGGFLEAEQGVSGMVFFDKTFLYGTTLWLFHKAGYPSPIFISALAVLLGIIEVLQTHLPGRTAEITDPLWLLILALILRLLDSADRQARATMATPSPLPLDRPGTIT
jgi:VanZ family protein